ncbi:sec-independent protein translocase TatC [Sphingobacteriaceae bacterium]|nr:sec-independent protein translocase TatC [Sphingobacteriaceae bacterium]
MNDIQSRSDIELLITTFYANLLKLEDIKPVFDGIDFPKHVPHIVSFWALILLDEEGYKANVFDKHINLPIKTYMFDKWLEVWIRAVDSLFNGERADLAKQRATVLAFTFKSKWEKMH